VLLEVGVPFDTAIARIAKLESVNGRMERLGGRIANDEPLVVIDYAHTPDALDKTLAALRPIAQARGGELICMFGCGGDRDATKRPLMGAIAERLADQIVITSDNPRSEEPMSIIDQIAVGMSDANKARRIEDRASAILQAIRSASREDVVVLAGKGHEATQEIMGKKRAFSDQDHARLALAARATQPSPSTARGGNE
jgi:UDP-N-acetylmuramoyl-L-alanyl-D-glutamate--2,6-diaminopimelate ligase